MSFLLVGASRWWPTPPEGDPYPLYTAFDRNQVPWHTASGDWGAQVSIDAPTQPTTSRSVTVHNATDFATEAATNGTLITVGTGWTGNSLATIAGDDIDVNLNGQNIGGLALPFGGDNQRIRIRGGGRMGQFYAPSGTFTDITIDGVDINADSNLSAGEANTAIRHAGTRWAVLNCRVISPGPGFGGGSSHFFVGNTNIYAAALSRTDAGSDEGWGLRHSDGSGPITIVDSMLSSTRYATLRTHCHTGYDNHFLYIGSSGARRSAIISYSEARLLWIWEAGTGLGDGCVIEDTDFWTYSDGDCAFLTSDILADDCPYTRFSNLGCYSEGSPSLTQAYLNSVQSSAVGAGRDCVVNTNHVFVDPWGAGPDWSTGPGDPRDVVMRDSASPVTGDGSFNCSGWSP